MKRQTITTLYGIAVFLMVLAVFIAYAQVTTELKIEGEGDATEQEGVYITDVEYLTNNGADTDSSEINYFLGTMLDSKVVLGSNSSSTITYQVTIKNNTAREQVFIGIIKDETNEEIYSNTSIQPNVETAGGITGIEAGKTTIAPGATITFPVTYAYAGTDISNSELQSKINFRFRELPIIELSNEGETYTLEDVAPGYEKEIEFTVSNYNENYTNGVPLTYAVEAEFTEGCPLETTIYDSEGNEVTGDITIAGDSTQVDHTYTFKLTWDGGNRVEEYLGQEYTCNVAVKATPDDAENLGYRDYILEKSFDINITTRGVIADGSWDGTINTPILTADMHPVAWDDEGNEFIPKTNEEWYDYVDQANGVDGTSNWANAKTSDGSYWVWIPRYEYKITSQPASSSAAGTIDVNFIPISTNITTSGYTTTTDVNQTVNGVEVLSKGITVSSDGYIIHPSFTSDVDVGGWDSELAGIWVAKYEMSMETNGVATETSNPTIGNVAISDTVKAVSKPGVTSWRYINISNCYNNSLAYDSIKNSHLMKNSEWGAVAYLTHSKYGRNGTEVSGSGNGEIHTGGGNGADAGSNVSQSSTGNASGIYDLAGGSREFVAAFNNKYPLDGIAYANKNNLSTKGDNMGTIGVTMDERERTLTRYSSNLSQCYIDEESGASNSSYEQLARDGYVASITGDAIAEIHSLGESRLVRKCFTDS